MHDSTALQETEQAPLASHFAAGPLQNIHGPNVLSGAEKTALARCERVIEKGLRTFHEVGQALLEVRDSRLYRREYENFADYCQQRWNFTHRHANQLIADAKTVAFVDGKHASQILTQRQATELGKVPAEDREKVLDWATEKADGAPLTAKAIKEAAAEVAEAETDVDVDGGDVVPASMVVPLDDDVGRLADRNNAAFYIQNALDGGEWIHGEILFRALNAPEKKVRAWLNESSVPEELENRYEMYKGNVSHELALLQGARVIETTLNAMVWLDIVEMRLNDSGGVFEYRLTEADDDE